MTFTREPQHRRSCSLTRTRKFFQIHSVQRAPQLAYSCLKYGRSGIDNCHGAHDCNDYHLQPSARFPSLLDFARIFLPVKHIFSCTKVRRNKLHPFSKISPDVFSLLFFKISPRSQFLDWRGCQLFLELWKLVSRRSLWFSSHGQFRGSFTTNVFLTVAALRINWAGVTRAKVVWSQVFGGCIHECEEKFLEQSYTYLSSVRPWCMRSCRKSLHVVHSVECLHVVRLVESHICTNPLRVHLERVHPLMKLKHMISDGEVLLAWIGCQM